MEPEIVVRSDLNSVAREAADRFVAIARQSIVAHGKFTLALSGGSTPRALFTLLASSGYQGQIDWEHTLVFWGDERCVPPDHADSNYRMARELLLAWVHIPEGNVHRARGEINPEQAALEYEQTVRREAPASTGIPSFDLILLGIGPDGHTASLFPGTPAIHEQTRLVVANFVPKLGAHRITFTPPLINAAAHVMFLASGADKADVLRAILEGEHKPDLLPAQIVKPASGQLTWLIDRTAAAHLRS
ncbi:MAG TPA: 6-phosphogluconolactonase [Anaerolineae bacterium]|nr:6-phosphogluconolactonase [Anaerolineae bacterium]